MVCRRSSGNPFGPDCYSNGVAYALIAQWVSVILVYTLAYHMMEPPLESYEVIEEDEEDGLSKTPFIVRLFNRRDLRCGLVGGGGGGGEAIMAHVDGRRKPKASSSSSHEPTPKISNPLTTTTPAKTRVEKSVRSRATRSATKDPKQAMTEEQESLARKEVNRCCGCRRKVGMTRFLCRCGELFCSEHRYSDRHDCSYDYKTAGRERRRRRLRRRRREC